MIRYIDDDTKPLMGFTAPMIRTDPWARPEPPKQRRPIGFVHFGEPEPDHEKCVAAYLRLGPPPINPQPDEPMPWVCLIGRAHFDTAVSRQPTH